MNGVIAQALPNAHFTFVDWSVVALYLAGTTLIGARLAGRQATIRDFFLGGRKLPWWAVAGSNIATEVSAVSFIGVPALVYAAGGDFRYLQLALGSIAARCIIAWVLVPAYYEREIYSPYDYMGRRLGRGVDTAATGLFMLGAVLSQSVRVLTTAIVLEIVTGIDLWWSIWLIGLFAVVWTLMGGITTVIWTDVIQFVVLMAGALVALGWILSYVPGGPAEAFRLARAAGKFRLVDLSYDPSREFTLWGGLVGMTFLNLAAFGTDQVMAQRMFCCRDQREARKAVLASNLGLIVPIVMLLVGAGLFAYFRAFPLSDGEQALVNDRVDRIFPIFIVKVLPPGITGLVIAAIFAAAISTLDGTLTALSQTTVAIVHKPWRRAEQPRKPPSSDPNANPAGNDSTADDLAAVRLSKLFVLLWGGILCAAATALVPVRGYANLINLALSVPGYTYGALLGILLLALLPFGRDDRGLPWAIPASVLGVIAVSARFAQADIVVWVTSAVLLGTAVVRFGLDLPRLATLALVLAGIVALFHLTHGSSGSAPRLTLAYPWYYPLGTIVTVVLGYGLGGKRGTTGGQEERLRPPPGQ